MTERDRKWKEKAEPAPGDPHVGGVRGMETLLPGTGVTVRKVADKTKALP